MRKGNSERGCVGPKLPVKEFKTFPAKEHKVNTADNQRKRGTNRGPTNVNCLTSEIRKRLFTRHLSQMLLSGDDP